MPSLTNGLDLWDAPEGDGLEHERWRQVLLERELVHFAVQLWTRSLIHLELLLAVSVHRSHGGAIFGTSPDIVGMAGLIQFFPDGFEIVPTHNFTNKTQVVR